MTSLEKWVTRLTEAGPKKIDKRIRRACAEAIIEKLALGQPRAFRAQYAFEINDRVDDFVQKARCNLVTLWSSVKADRVAAATYGLSNPLLEEVRHVQRQLSAAHKKAAKVRAATPKPQRGRKRENATALAELIAKEYLAHFGDRPGSARRSSEPIPFTRMCDVVERILKPNYPRLSIGYEARRDAVRRLKLTKTK
jgi:hypothetical protein